VKLIFVYGTLKRGCINHFRMEGQEFSGEAQTGPGYVLHDVGGYPGMVPDPAARDGVRGEVWCVDAECLADLDLLEGIAEGLYGRRAVELKAPFAGRHVEAYFYLESVEGRRRLGGAWSE
jgi:gamma-glutamylaminecyclotransferase